MNGIVLQIIAALLTIMVLSRIFGDNPFFRIAQYLFVGVSLGLTFVVAYQEVLRPAVVALLSLDNAAIIIYLVPLVLGLLLLPRITRQQRASWLANIPLALIFGVGAALAAGGAVAGTLLPQISANMRPTSSGPLGIFSIAVLALGTVAVLSRFYFTTPTNTRRGQFIQQSAVVGHWILMLAFGFFFAGAVQTYLAALTERIGALVSLITQFF